jgi:hypothetical protein
VAEILDAIEFQRLYDSRELAALNCVNAIQFVLAMFEEKEFAKARPHLQHALGLHKEADDAITEWHKSQTRKKENTNVQLHESLTQRSERHG